MSSCPDRETSPPQRELPVGGQGDGDIIEPPDRLLATAVPVFAQRGFDRATVREIARKADVNVAAVSYYFGDKLGLYRAVIEKIRDKRQREFPAPAVGDAPPEETLLRIVRTLLSRMLAGDERGFEAMLMMREMQSPTAVFSVMVREYFKPILDALYATINQLLESAQANDSKSQEKRAKPPSACTSTPVAGARPLAGARPSECDEASGRHEALLTQVALGVVGQCLYYRIGRPVLEHLIAPSARAEHYDPESLCRHITASTLAVCGRFDILQELDHLNKWSGSVSPGMRTTNPPRKQRTL